jgi:hypothetical protein
VQFAEIKYNDILVTDYFRGKKRTGITKIGYTITAQVFNSYRFVACSGRLRIFRGIYERNNMHYISWYTFKQEKL